MNELRLNDWDIADGKQRRQSATRCWIEVELNSVGLVNRGGGFKCNARCNASFRDWYSWYSKWCKRARVVNDFQRYVCVAVGRSSRQTICVVSVNGCNLICCYLFSLDCDAMWNGAIHKETKKVRLSQLLTSINNTLFQSLIPKKVKSRFLVNQMDGTENSFKCESNGMKNNYVNQSWSLVRGDGWVR